MEPRTADIRTRPLRRSTADRMVAGVAAGVADHLGLDVTVVRLAVVLACLVGGLGLPLYVAAWLLVPEDGSERSVADELLGRGAA